MTTQTFPSSLYNHCTLKLLSQSSPIPPPKRKDIHIIKTKGKERYFPQSEIHVRGSYVLGKLTDALDVLQKKAQDLQGVSGQIEQMKLELGLIKGFLRDAGSKRKGNEFIKEWVNQVRDMAYKIEDLIDTFLVEVEDNQAKSSWLTKPYKMNKLGGDLEEITQKLNWIYRRGTDLGTTVVGAGSEENRQIPFRPTKPCDIDDSEVVGLEADKRKIIKQLLDRNISRRTVLSIVGTGGHGKTTLAQKVYKSAELERRFDCCTWLSISQKFKLIDQLREILYSIEPRMRQQNPPVTDEDLPVKVKSSLSRKRYLIILDDVWTIDPWDQLKIALPDLNKASRVIITTRSLEVARAADCNTKPYELCCLNESESLALLFKKAFQVQHEDYPPGLFQVAKRLTKKCGGLPLALVVLGGILSRRERNKTAWSKLEQTMDWHNKDGKKCSQVLAMSYEDLPYYLKPCFLYFASFPEDYVISGKHVTKMWIAEGFIPKDGAGTMEDRAEGYLEELVQRCLIQVIEKSWNGYCKRCRMHNLLRDLAIREAKEENFFTVFSKPEDVDQLAVRKPRRAALQFCTITKNDVHSENTRSLLYFDLKQDSSNHSGFRLLNYSGFRLLRVLTIEHVDMTNFACGEWLKGLIHLRYLGFRYCTIGQQIFNKNSFYNLENIDLKGTEIGSSCHHDELETIDWSDVVTPTLRHVYGSKNLERIFPLKWDHLTNLQTLKSVGHEEVPKLECCINLRTLGIYYDKNDLTSIEEWKTLKGVLGKMEQLVSLRIETRREPEFFVPFGIDGTIGLPCHAKIERINLCGRLTRVPSVGMFPTNLTKLTLEHTRLEEDPMPIFEKLERLRILRLGRLSYEGTKMVCSTKGFPSLEKMDLIQLTKLRHWDIKEGAMPILSSLRIDDCKELHALPELQKVRTLQELIVFAPSSELRQRMKRDVDLDGIVQHVFSLVQMALMQPEDHYKFRHIPSVRLV